MKRRIRVRKKRQNRLGMFLVTTVVIMLLLVVTIKGAELNAQQEVYDQKKAVLEEQIKEEELRSESIQEYKKYTKTKKFAEDVAKDKLGLVHEDEIIFKTEE